MLGAVSCLGVLRGVKLERGGRERGGQRREDLAVIK